MLFKFTDAILVVPPLQPVWMKVCFFMSDFWWNLFPQYWHG